MATVADESPACSRRPNPPPAVHADARSAAKPDQPLPRHLARSLETQAQQAAVRTHLGRDVTDWGRLPDEPSRIDTPQLERVEAREYLRQANRSSPPTALARPLCRPEPRGRGRGMPRDSWCVDDGDLRESAARADLQAGLADEGDSPLPPSRCLGLAELGNIAGRIAIRIPDERVLEVEQTAHAVFAASWATTRPTHYHDIVVG